MLTLLKNWYYRHFSEPGTIEFAVVLIAIFLIVYYLMWLVGPLVVALCIGYFLDAFVVYFEKRFHLQRKYGSLLVMLLFITLVLLFVILIAPLVIKQATGFYNTILLLGDNVAGALHVENNHTTDIYSVDALIAEHLYNIIAKLPEPLPSMITYESLLNYTTQSRKMIMAGFAGIIRTNLMPSVINVFTYLVYLVIVPIFTFLMLYNKHKLLRTFRHYILPNNQIILNKFWPSLNAQLEGYVRGKILHIIIISIVNSLVFVFFNLNYAILLGIGVGLSVVIPYVGAVIIAIPVVAVALLQFGLSSLFLWLLLIYTIIQLLDSNILTPLLFSKISNLDAFSILSAILIFGGLWGFWGVFFAIPLATIIKTIITKWPSTENKKVLALNHKGKED